MATDIKPPPTPEEASAAAFTRGRVMADDLQRVRARRRAEEARKHRRELLAEIEARSRWVSGALVDAVSPLERRHVMVDYPAHRDVPIAVLRRLHKALEAFVSEAQAAENAKLQRQVERGGGA